MPYVGAKEVLQRQADFVDRAMKVMEVAVGASAGERTGDFCRGLFTDGELFEVYFKVYFFSLSFAGQIPRRLPAVEFLCNHCSKLLSPHGSQPTTWIPAYDLMSSALSALRNEILLAAANDDSDEARPSKLLITLTNESPFLLLSSASVASLVGRIAEQNAADPLLSCEAASETSSSPEDPWRDVQIGSQVFEVLGGCRRAI